MATTEKKTQRHHFIFIQVKQGINGIFMSQQFIITFYFGTFLSNVQFTILCFLLNKQIICKTIVSGDSDRDSYEIWHNQIDPTIKQMSQNNIRIEMRKISKFPTRKSLKLLHKMFGHSIIIVCQIGKFNQHISRHLSSIE